MRELLRTTLTTALAEQPLLDAHTHRDAAYLAARGPHDILPCATLQSVLGIKPA